VAVVEVPMVAEKIPVVLVDLQESLEDVTKAA
jgi:hypothetical protein